MNVIIIQPPIVQLNTAYPSGAYLSAFFKKQGCTVKWYDMNIELFHALFCKEGITKLFTLTEKDAVKKAEAALRQNDEATYSNIMAYLSMGEAWVKWIDVIVQILEDGNSFSTRELCHRFVFSPDVPRGARMNAYLENLDHEPGTDDARFLASLAVADLADYITAVFDPQFSLVRYAESIAVSEASFANIENKIDSPVLANFYEELLKKTFSPENSLLKNTGDEKTLVCISIPFAGTFTAALCTGRFFKQNFSDKVFVSAGGGFINTELRECEETAVEKYFDSISYDRGYGSYLDFFTHGCKTSDAGPLYKMRLFKNGTVTAPKETDAAIQKEEDELTSIIVPDFSDIDFSLYPRMVDDVNPMQRLWSDGTWIKAYLAHGCYWHRCAFCDTTLDYVHSYRMTKVEQLFNGLYSQCEQKKVYGIHFVDEALPPAALKKFALMNSQKKVPLTFWGNVRFEKTYTRDLADLLSYGGLVGVSGGIEIATGSGLDTINKGTDLNSIVSACCAFKEAGILVHAYMIFGYWNESEQDLINSMETLRQFFAEGLLDSSFWHKFTLTRHSKVYDEWKKGMHKDLCPEEIKGSGLFAKNALHFKGEEKSEKFSDGLNLALQSWMHGERLNMSVNKWFNFKTPLPTVPKDLIQKAIAHYEKERDRQFSLEAAPDHLYWLGGKLLVLKNKFVWTFKGELFEEKIPQGVKYEEALQFASDFRNPKLQGFFRGRGLCVY